MLVNACTAEIRRKGEGLPRRSEIVGAASLIIGTQARLISPSGLGVETPISPALPRRKRDAARAERETKRRRRMHNNRALPEQLRRWLGAFARPVVPRE